MGHFLAVRMGMVDVAEPLWLALIVLIVPIIYLWQTSRVAASPLRRWVSLVMRLALVTGLILALAGTRVLWNNKGICVVFVLDESQSVPAYAQKAMREKLAEEIGKMGREDQFVVIEFGGEAVLDCLPSFKGPLPPPAGGVDTGRTDIARALRLAMASFPADRQRRIVLLSDGNQNAGDAVHEARIAALKDVDINTVLIGARGAHEVMVDQLVLPPRVQKDAHFVARAIISSDQAQGATLLVSRDGQPMPSQHVTLKAGSNVFDLPDSISRGGFHEYQVTVVPEGGPEADTFAANNTANGFTQVDAPGKVLVIHGKSGEHDYLSDALVEDKIEVESGPVSALPLDLQGLMPYDCVVLENVNRFPLAPAQMATLARWVKDFGGGVVLVGGDESFGPGGYKGTPLEEISPVEMDVKRKKHLASVAMCIVLDKSGSMGVTAKDGREKIELADQGCVETLKLLTAADEAQIGAVDTEVKWMTESRLVPITEGNRQRMKENVLAVRAGGGGILCKTALEHAYELVNAPSVQAMSRHVIMFADTSDSDQQEDCVAMAAKNFKKNPSVTTTVIGLGEMTDPHVKFQQEVARAGGGRWYITDDAMALPRIFVKEAFIASRNAFVEKKEGITPTMYDSPLLQGILTKGVPKVYGYVGTTLKPRATLAAHGLEADDPLIAHWAIGLGKAVAFTSDATDRWGKDWVAWEGFNKFWAQTVRWASKSVQNTQLATNTTIEGSEGRITVEATGADGKPLNNLQLQGNVGAPDQNEATASAPLVQVAPGRYEGKFNVGARGTYMVNVVDKSTGNTVDSSAAVMSYPAEFRDLTPNAALLRALAETTGGQEIKELNGVFVPKAKPVRTAWPLWEPLLLFTVIGLMVDVAWRRLNVADWFRAQQRAVVMAGTGSAVGAFQVVRSGRREVSQQTQNLRAKLDARGAGSIGGGQKEESADLADLAGMAREGGAVGTASGGNGTVGNAEVEKREEKSAGEGYANRLMGAKKRAAEQIKDQEKKG